MIKLFSDFEPDELIFNKLRKTSTGSRIIDIKNEEILQTPWLKIEYDTDYGISVNIFKIKHLFEKLEEKFKNTCIEKLEFTKEEIDEMYKSLIRNDIFNIPLHTNTILFDNLGNYYTKDEIKKIVGKGDTIRILFRFKKIYYNDHVINIPFEVIQIEQK